MSGSRDDLKISIFVPEGGSPPTNNRSTDPARDHSLLSMIGLGRVEEVGVQDVRGQWAQTIATVLDLGSLIRDEARGWTVDEMEVGLTLSASGKLLFIAEAGAEASITLKLTRSAPPVSAGSQRGPSAD
jgi:hypothetical protein